MIFHHCLWTNGHDTSSRLVRPGPQLAVEPTDCYYYYYYYLKVYIFTHVHLSTDRGERMERMDNA